MPLFSNPYAADPHHLYHHGGDVKSKLIAAAPILHHSASIALLPLGQIANGQQKEVQAPDQREGDGDLDMSFLSALTIGARGA
jgi:hypothetical protein